MIEIRNKPIVEWPGPLTKDRRRSPFSAKYNQTRTLLDRELNFLRAKNVVLQIALEPQQFRLDGMPYANAKPSHPGIILTFDSPKGAMSFPCDTYLDWESNLRAIALSLEALRSVDRYGVTRRAEQYRGWQALPAPEVRSAFSMEAAAEFVLNAAGFSGETAVSELLGDDFNVYRQVYRVAAKRLHPDTGGNEDEFKRLQEADALLKTHWEAATK